MEDNDKNSKDETKEVSSSKVSWKKKSLATLSFDDEAAGNILDAYPLDVSLRSSFMSLGDADIMQHILGLDPSDSVLGPLEQV